MFKKENTVLLLYNLSAALQKSVTRQRGQKIKLQNEMLVYGENCHWVIFFNSQMVSKDVIC